MLIMELKSGDLFFYDKQFYHDIAYQYKKEK